MTLNEKEEKIRFFMIFIIIAASSFLVGLIVRYLIPQSFSLCKSYQNSLKTALILQSENGFFSLPVLASAFTEDAKFFFFVFVAGFTNYADKLFVCLSLFKGITSGFCTASLMCLIKSGEIIAKHQFLTTFVFTLYAVSLIAGLCLFCSVSLYFSKKHLQPFGLKPLLKRKTTYLFILDFLVFCGTAFILILIKQGNFLFMIS
ncbi:MAG: hypothetical protein IKL40_05205 [Clostridia bacterium]|nr:hypothetical protein [Clostridia bacterium]